MNVKKAIIISLISISIVGIAAFSLKHKDKSTNQPIMHVAYAESNQETITNLTGTKWIFNDSINLINQEYLINFTSNSISYSSISGEDEVTYRLYYDNTIVNNRDTWVNQEYRTIIIANGTDINNTELIEWLSQNATLQPQIHDLTGTKWKINNTIETQSTDKSYSINYYSNYDRNLRYQTLDIQAPSTIYYNNVKTLNANVWESYKYQTIFIIDGTNVQNANLLAFLNTNAEYLGTFTPPAPPIDIEDGNMVSIQTLMLNILTLPFTFITKAFDITLWPNTAYEFNIGNFIMGIIAISAVLFIIKLFTSGFAVVGNYTNKSSQTKLNKAKTKQIKQQTKQAKSESDNKE